MAKIISKLTGAASAISIPAIIIAVAFSMVIGIVFGLIPAIKASHLNPIEALRRE
jgi:putative ABC transport system permease protein